MNSAIEASFFMRITVTLGGDVEKWSKSLAY